MGQKLNTINYIISSLYTIETAIRQIKPKKNIDPKILSTLAYCQHQLEELRVSEETMEKALQPYLEPLADKIGDVDDRLHYHIRDDYD